MPTNWYRLVPAITDSIREADPKSILEVAVGLGKFGGVIRHALDSHFSHHQSRNRGLRLDGVELLADFRTQFHEHIYDNVYHRDMSASFSDLPRYDVVFLGDVLNYFDKNRGHELLRELLRKTKKTLIMYSPKFEWRTRGSVPPETAVYRSRWWELDFGKYDAMSFTVKTESGPYSVFQVYPLVREQIRDRKEDSVRVPSVRRPLEIAYCLPHKNLTGGVKTLLQQMEQLQKLGHKVTIVYEGQNDERALPPWSTFGPFNEIVIRDEKQFRRELRRYDAIVAGWVAQLPKLATLEVPVLYWEKGYEYLFGDIPSSSVAAKVRKQLADCYSVPCEIVSVSSTVSELLRIRYGRVTSVVPNGIDLAKYYPAPYESSRETKTVLLVGNPALRFKGFDIALKSLAKVWESGLRFKVRWVCQLEPRLSGVPFPVEVVVNPPQDELPVYYREADIHLFTSWYEGFGMPPLEAMASGVAVVATDFGGGSEYLVPGVNALVADPGDIDSLAAAVAYLLKDEAARMYLAREGRKTAEKFDISSIARRLEQHLFRVVAT